MSATASVNSDFYPPGYTTKLYQIHIHRHCKLKTSFFASNNCVSPIFGNLSPIRNLENYKITEEKF